MGNYCTYNTMSHDKQPSTIENVSHNHTYMIHLLQDSFEMYFYLSFDNTVYIYLM